VDAERKAASAAIGKMNTLSGPLENTTSAISEAGNPINLMDSISSFLKFLERFNSIVDGIAEV
jgi:hypothetical protein